jgi:hypothetical protein
VAGPFIVDNIVPKEQAGPSRVVSRPDAPYYHPRVNKCIPTSVLLLYCRDVLQKEMPGMMDRLLDQENTPIMPKSQRILMS